MTNDSFTFGGVDMFETYGIRVVTYEVLAPQLRRRKRTIPLRSGSYDYGARYYDDREIKVECDTRACLTRDQIRELSYTLSKKARIVFWDEPDKYYIGRVYDPSELEHIGGIGYEFVLVFECDPFAYAADQTVIETQAASYFPVYDGTAPTPVTVMLTNIGGAVAQGVKIVIRKRRDRY